VQPIAVSSRLISPILMMDNIPEAVTFQHFSKPPPNSHSLRPLTLWRFKIAFWLGPKIASLPIHEFIWETMTPSAPAKVFRVCRFTIIKRFIQNQAPRFRLQ
jgi:hypothetical protein